MRREFNYVVIYLLVFGAFSQNQRDVYVDMEKIDTWADSDSLLLSARINDFISDQWERGHLFAGLDSLTESAIFLHRGSRLVLNYHSKNIRFNNLVRRAKGDLENNLNHGFPFAKIHWKTVPIINNQLPIEYVVYQGPLILNDSILLKRPVKIRQNYLRRVLDFSFGETFSEESYLQANDRLDRISFLKVNNPVDVSFQDGKAWLYLDLEEKSTGSFEGVLGVLPGQSQREKALITGSIDLELLNLFRSGKELEMNWQGYDESSQRLATRYKHPYLGGSNISLSGSIGLQKQDTSFLNRNLTLTLGVFSGASTELQFSYQKSGSNVLSTSSEVITENGWENFEQELYSIGLSKGLENISTMGDGLHLKASLGIGQRRIIKSGSVSVDHYDSVELIQGNVRIEGDFEFQKTISRKSAFYTNLVLRHISGSQVLRNQQFRVGGLRSLRGFNEQFFYASNYVINQLEWRYFFEEQSYLFVFYDQGFLENQQWSYPMGIGSGFSLQTNSGLFSFAFAAGTTKDLPFELSAMKVHFGYLSKF